MARICFSFFLLHVISTLSLVIPNDDLLNDVISSKSKRLIPPSYSVLNTRSSLENQNGLVSSEQAQFFDSSSNPKVNVRKRQAFNFADENTKREYFSTQSEANENFSNKGQTRLKIDKNRICLLPEWESDEQIICVDPSLLSSSQNISDRVYMVTRDDDKEEKLFKNQTKDFVVGYGPKSSNFIRYGRSPFSKTMFSRFDRGRDNFMRLGRSRINRRYASQSEEENQKMKNYVNQSMKDLINNLVIRSQLPQKDVRILRLGRGADKFGFHLSRKSDNFMRFGRSSDSIPYLTSKYDNFMRFGRLTGAKRQDNFMRFGRLSNNHQLETNTKDGSKHIYDRVLRKQDNFMRLGRRPESEILTWLEKMGKHSIPTANTVHEECSGVNCKERFSEPEDKRMNVDDDTDTDLTRMRRRYDSFIRLGRAFNLCSLPNADWTPEAIQNLIKNRNSYLHRNFSGPLNAFFECLEKYVENSANETAANDEKQIIFEKVSELDSEGDIPKEKFARAARRRGLLLRFGRSDFSSAEDFANSPENYSNLEAFSVNRYPHKNLPDFIAQDTHLL